MFLPTYHPLYFFSWKVEGSKPPGEPGLMCPWCKRFFPVIASMKWCLLWASYFFPHLLGLGWWGKEAKKDFSEVSSFPALQVKVPWIRKNYKKIFLSLLLVGHCSRGYGKIMCSRYDSLWRGLNVYITWNYIKLEEDR